MKKVERVEMGKAILLVCDGLGDRPFAERGGKTPLQVAKKPNSDELAREGINGQMDVISPGIVPGSDTAHLALLGYDPFQCYPGRGTFEALGAGIELKEGDIAFRGNFATVAEDGSMRILDRRAGRFGSKALADALNGIEINGVEVIVKHTVEHRCAVVFRGEGLSRFVSDVDPHEEGLPPRKCIPTRSERNAERTARIVNEFVRRSHEILSEHPENEERRRKGVPVANILLLRGAGAHESVEPFQERFGFKACCIAGASLYKGVAKFLGIPTIDVEGATGNANTNLKAKAESAIEALKTHDFVFVHVKATDNFGHDGDFDGKVRMIERIDAEMISLFREIDAYVVVTADHSTPVSLRRHSADPVPVVICGDGVRTDTVQKFDEFAAASGGLGRLRGKDLIPILSDLMGFYKMFGT
nr:2,3-bisphosphoglycerate-independent phosphoglycerate mutase [Methanophagales archaeon]